MLIDHTQLTDPALAGLFPVRLVHVDWLGHKRASARSVFFLYQHFHGCWAVGSADGRNLNGHMALDKLVVSAFRGAQLSEAEALVLFEETLDKALTFDGVRLPGQELTCLPAEFEHQLAQVWGFQPEVHNMPGLGYRLARELRRVVDTVRLPPEVGSMAAWLTSLDPPTAPDDSAELFAHDAKLWACLLEDAGLSQQDGVPDALRVLQHQGASAFCALLDPTTLATVASWLEQTRKDFPETAPRCTVADVVRGSLALNAELLLQHWNERPLVRHP